MRGEIIPDASQQRVLSGSGLRPIDQLAGRVWCARIARELCNAILTEHRDGIRIERIEKQPVRRRVWPIVRGIRREQAVRWTERDGIGTLTRGTDDQITQSRSIAEPAVAIAPQGIKLHAETVHPLAGRDVVERDAA